jgi:hypothetical protein
MQIGLLACATLALMTSAAQARPLQSGGYAGTYRPTNTVAPMHVTSRQLPPDRADRVGTLPPDSVQQLSPDRVDGIGTSRQATTATVVVASSSDSFDWADATIGAAFALALGLVAAAALAVRGRRRVAYSS